MKTTKKLLAVCLALALVVSLFAMLSTLTVSAVSNEDTGYRYLESSEIYWYSDTKTTAPYSSGSGTEGDPYIVETAAQLRLLAIGNTGGGGKYYKLGNDIEINDTTDPYWYEGTGIKNWIKGTGDLPNDGIKGQFSEGRNRIEMGGNLFRDNFDGDGHTISGLYINYEGTGIVQGRNYCGWGLFPDVYNGASFKNVKLKDVYIKSRVTASDRTEDYHGYGALVGIVNGEQPITFQNVQVENVKFDISKPNLSAAGKPVGVGGIFGYSYGNLTVTDAIVKNVTAKLSNWYATSRCAAFVGAVTGAVGWAHTVTLTNVLTIGNMNPMSCSSATSGGAVTISSGNNIQDIVANQSIVISGTNCYAIGAEKVHDGAGITIVSDEDTFISSYLSTFNSNKGASTNWSIKDNNMPMLKDLALLECDFSNYSTMADYSGTPSANSNWTVVTDGGNQCLRGDLTTVTAAQDYSFTVTPNHGGNGTAGTKPDGYYGWTTDGPVKPGRIYRLAFKAKSSAACIMNYNILNGYSYAAGQNNRGEHYDYSRYDPYNRSSAALTTSWQNFSMYFTAEYYPNGGGGTNRVIFQINYGGPGGKYIYFDDMVLTEVSGVALKVGDNKYTSPYVAYDGDSIVLPETISGYAIDNWYTDEGHTSLLNTAATKVGDAKIAYAVKHRNFATHSLVLTDSIGLNFFVDLSDLADSELPNTERKSCYVTFSISKGSGAPVEGVRADYNESFTSATGGYYGFTCPLSSVQMAEYVTPTLHYGDNTDVGDAYSVKDYIDYVNAHSGDFNANVVTAVNAIGNYGYYAQVYLGAKNGWTAGTNYTALASSYGTSYSSSDYTDKKSAVAGKAIIASGISNGANIGQFQYALNLDFETSVVLKFNTADVNFTSITKGGANYANRKNAYTASNCTLYLLHLPVSQLANNFSVAGKVNGSTDFTITISGLTYVYGVLNSNSTSTNAKNLASAIYDYHTAAMALL